MNTSQREEIRGHLTRNGSINKRESERLYGCERLASRILELRKEGMDITANRVKVLNRWGKAVFVAEYWLETEEQRRLL